VSIVFKKKPIENLPPNSKEIIRVWLTDSGDIAVKVTKAFRVGVRTGKVWPMPLLRPFRNPCWKSLLL
jgi:hypothetical protein